MKILLMSGSFHSKSRSLAILAEIQRYFPEHDHVLPKLDELPFYNEDLNANKPRSILDFMAQVESSDGIIVCSPEYNHSIPAVLKNAIDWASRPAFDSALKDKPVTLITQASSLVGGARAQAHIKLVFDSTLSVIYPCHEMMISGVDKIFDTNYSISDIAVKQRLKRHVLGFIEFIDRTS